MWGWLSFPHSAALEWPQHSISAAVWVQNTSLALPPFIEVPVPSQKRVNDHLFLCCEYWFCLHFYVSLVVLWNCPDGDALHWFSYFWGKFQLELYFIIFQKLTTMNSRLPVTVKTMLPDKLWLYFKLTPPPFFWYVARKDLTQHRKWRVI